jgi:hypothetical protein
MPVNALKALAWAKNALRLKISSATLIIKKSVKNCDAPKAGKKFKDLRPRLGACLGAAEFISDRHGKRMLVVTCNGKKSAARLRIGCMSQKPFGLMVLNEGA